MAPMTGLGGTGSAIVPQGTYAPLTGGVSASGASGGAAGGQSQVIDVSPTTTETYNPTSNQTYTPTYSPTTTVSTPTTNTVNQSYTQNNNAANQSTVLAAAMGGNAASLSPAQTGVPASSLNPLTLQGAAQAKYTPNTYTPPTAASTALPSALNPSIANPYLRQAAPTSGSLQGYSGPPQSGYAISNAGVPAQAKPFPSQLQLSPQELQLLNQASTPAYDPRNAPQQAAQNVAPQQAPAGTPAPQQAGAQTAAVPAGQYKPDDTGDMSAPQALYDPYTAKYSDPIPAGASIPASETKRMLQEQQEAIAKGQAPGTPSGAPPSNPNKPSTFAALPWYAKLGMAMSPRAQAAFSARQKLNNDWVKDFAMKSYEAGLQEHKLEKEQGMIGDREKALQQQKHEDKIAEDKAKDGSLNANQKREALQWHLEHTDPGSEERLNDWHKGILSFEETKLPRTSGSTLTEDNQRANLQGKQYENTVAGATMLPNIQSAFAGATSKQNDATLSSATLPGQIAGNNARNAEAVTNAQTAQATQASDIAAKAYGAIKQWQDVQYAPIEQQRAAVGSLANMLKVTTDAAFAPGLSDTDKRQLLDVAKSIINVGALGPMPPAKGMPGYVPQRGSKDTIPSRRHGSHHRRH